MVTFQLGQIEKLISEQLPAMGEKFVRIGKSLIVNIDNVFLINIGRQQLILSDGMQNRYTLSASKEALKALKEYIERKKL